MHRSGEVSVLRIGLSGAGALLWAALYLLLTPIEFFSLIAAVMMHEIGHILVLMILDSGVDCICLTGAGLRIDCRIGLSWGEEILAALAGPVFGALWCICSWYLGLHLSCRLSAALTLFNLLPLSYMDGGRALHGIVALAAGGKKAEQCGRLLDAAVSLLFCALGLFSAMHGLGDGIAVMAAWISLYAVQKRRNTLD